MLILAPVLTVLLAASPQAPPLPDLLVIAAVVTDKKGRPVTDLKPEELVVQENGESRPMLRAERDTRPLRVALVLDTSASMGPTYAADVIPAAMTFLKKLPPGAVFSIWATSDRAKRIVDEGTEIKAAEDKMRNLAPFGYNAAIHAMVAASQEIGPAEDHHPAVVLVTSASMGEVTVDLQSLLPQASLKPTYVAVEVVLESADQDPRLEDGLKLLVSRTAGFHERVFSTMSIGGQLDRVLDVLSSQYRMAWKPGADPRQVKIEVKVKRPNTKVVQAQRISTAW